MSISNRILCFVLIFIYSAVGLRSTQSLVACQAATAGQVDGGTPKTEQELRSELDKLFGDLREVMIQCNAATKRYYNGEYSDSAAQRKIFEEEFERGVQLKLAIREIVVSLAEIVKVPDAELRGLIALANRECAATGQYETVYKLSQLMLALEPENENWKHSLGIATITTNRFAEANEIYQNDPGIVLKFPQNFRDLYSQLPELLAAQAEEKERDERAAQADDLPRVLIKTTKGDIVAELFENEAPETVGNFLNLVEKEFYDGLLFFAVVANYKAQTGSPTNDLSGTAGYFIRDEYNRPDRRHHFTYVLAMAGTEQPNQSSSQFYITHWPDLELDKNRTVFGRIISGFENFKRLNPTSIVNAENEEKPLFGVVPDKIISITVLRKRNHEYVPTIDKDFR